LLNALTMTTAARVVGWWAATMLVARAAGAQHTNAIPSSNGEGFDTHLFRPALDARGLVSLNGADVLPAGHVSLGLTIDYGRDLLRLPGGASRQSLVDHSFAGTLQFDYGVANRAVIGVSAPAVVMHGEPQAGVTGWSPAGVDGQAIGFIALHGKLELTRPSGPLGVALAAQVGAPVSGAQHDAGADPSIWYWPSVAFEKRLGASEEVRLVANVGYRGHAASTTTLDLEGGTFRDGSRVTYGAGGSVRVLPAVDLVAETYGTYLLGPSSAGVKPSNEALGGIRLSIERSSHLVLAAGTRYTGGFEAANLRGVVSFVFEPPAYDSDGDGVVDGEDECPQTPGVRQSGAKSGCPLDSDDDGIMDSEDACPFVKGPRTDDPRTNGCPPIRDVPPPPPDRDQDGIPDAVDACPDLFGPRHPDPKRNGCPDVYLGPTEIVVFDQIMFRTNSAEILPASNPILDKIAKLLLDHPELVLLEVAGHADERGSEKLNLALTQARVDSVMVALAARSVDRARLRSRGYGYYCPREEGHDEDAWRKNRRVEFIVVKKQDGPTGAPLGCERATAHGVSPAPVPR
jgi:outer membrane protein OmpA-like peptidoglycan-associated protein